MENFLVRPLENDWRMNYSDMYVYPTDDWGIDGSGGCVGVKTLLD